MKNSGQCPQLQCAKCNRSFPFYFNYFDHVVKVHEEAVKCDKCGEEFESHRKHHTHTHKPCGASKKQTGEYTCDICDTSFARREYLSRHVNETHFKDRTRLFVCDNCGKSFKNYGHYKRHEGKPCTSRYTCEYCGHWCRSERVYTNHLLTKHIRSIPCAVCEAEFDSGDHYNKHMRNMHCGRDMVYECDFVLCGYTTTNYRNLHVHILRHLRDEIKYTCDICNKTYLTKGNFKSHMNTHTGVANNQCHVCGKSYAVKCSFDKHMKRFHPELFPRAKQCPHCHLLVMNKEKYQAHVARHEVQRHICDVCGKSLSSATVLSEHRRIHTGEHPFECHVCHRRFTAKKYLRSHNKVHTKEQPHSCMFCMRKFSQRTSMVKHRQSCTMMDEVVQFDAPDYTAMN